MPKKPPANAFFFFMQAYRHNQMKKGIHYASLAEVAEAAGPSWAKAGPEERAKYQDMAKAAKGKNKGAGVKYTSTGIPLSVIEQQDRERKEAEEAERADIINLVRLKSINKSILTEDFFLIDVNIYCKTRGRHTIAECTVTRFSIQEGVKDSYHEVINPGTIPTGYCNEVKVNCKKLALDEPDEEGQISNYMQILAYLIDYLKKQDPNVKTLPAMYTMPNKVPAVLDFIQQLCDFAGEDAKLFRVYRVDTLFYHLIQAISEENKGFPLEVVALMELQKDSFEYTLGLACEMHERKEMQQHCTRSRSKRWAFMMLDACLARVDVPVLPGRHLPADLDLECILACKEQRRNTARVAPSLDQSLDSTLNSTVASTSAADVSVIKKEKRTHVPQRMPRTDYSQNIRAPPNLTSEDDFPDMRRLGAGRGRGLAGSFSKMNM